MIYPNLGKTTRSMGIVELTLQTTLKHFHTPNYLFKRIYWS